MRLIIIVFLTITAASIADWKPIEANVSAYCCCKKCCGKDPNHPAYGITASGHKVKKGDRLVAADRRYKFGTIFRIDGYNNGNPVKCLDRGGAIKDNKIDLLFDTHQEALNWGRKHMTIYVWKD
jgi:3D (Asp-Asp-Asp) domain-containing protein